MPGIQGPKGATGDQGAKGDTGPQGPAATIKVGTVTTAAYGTPASAKNSGTSSAAVIDFVIPQGAPGEAMKDVSELTANDITESTASYPYITAGEKMKIVLGKIKKYLADLKNNAASLASKITAAEKNITSLTTKVGSSTLATTAKDLSGAVNEVNTANKSNATSIGTLQTSVKTNADAIAQLNSDMLVKIVASSNNSVTFTVKRPTDQEARYTCFLCLVKQSTDEVGAYLIGINSQKDSIHKIHGIDATITRSGEEITVTFPDNYLYANGFAILPRVLT